MKYFFAHHLPFPPQLQPKPKPSLRMQRAAAFSLTEVVIAMGVAAVAFTSIIALFPLGLNMSKESYESTQAALLAQTLMADVKDQQTGNGDKRTPSAPYKTKLIQIAENSDPAIVSSNYAVIRLDSTTPQLIYLAYNQLPRNNSDTDPAKSIMLRPVAYSSNLPSWYTTGSNGLFAVAKITVSPSCRFGSASSTSSPMRVDISIETPGSANVTNRTCYLFTGLARP
jgi:type II secretory pathway pseudopilin PulG